MSLLFAHLQRFLVSGRLTYTAGRMAIHLRLVSNYQTGQSVGASRRLAVPWTRASLDRRPHERERMAWTYH